MLVLDLMGLAYMRLLSDRDLLRLQLQAYAACGDDDVRQVVREEFAALYASVKQDSGASNEELHHFFAEGMLLNVAAALELGGDAGDLVAQRPARARPATPAEREAPPDDRRPPPLFSPLVLSDH